MKLIRQSSRMGRAFIAISLCSLSAALTQGAVPIGNSNVQIGGFFSQGFIESNGNNFPFENNDGTFNFREMAVNVSTTVGDHLRLGAQGFAQRLGNYGGDKVILDWAVADYNFRQEFGVRVGRIKYPKGLYGEALDLDAIRPFVFLPMNIYNPILRDFSSSFDGAMLYGTLNVGKAGSLDYKVFYGDIAMNTDMGVADFINSANLFAAGVQEIGVDNVKGVAFDWTPPVSGLKIHASYSELKNIMGSGGFVYMPVLPISLTVENIGFTSVGVEYIHDKWTFAAEWFRESGPVHILAAPALDSHTHFGNDNYYVSVARRFHEKWEVGGYFAQAKDRFPSSGDPSAAKHMNDWVLCIRYDITEHITVKLEGHSISGYYNTFNTAKNPNPTFEDSTSFIAVKTTLSF